MFLDNPTRDQVQRAYENRPRRMPVVADFGSSEEFTPVAIVERADIMECGTASVLSFREYEAIECEENE